MCLTALTSGELKLAPRVRWWLLLAVLPGAARAFDLVEALPLTERIIMVHFREGHAEHHQKGQKRTEGEKVVLTPPDSAAATRPENWTISCAEDHWLYLFLPQPLVSSKTYTVKAGTIHQNTCFAAATFGWLCKGR